MSFHATVSNFHTNLYGTIYNTDGLEELRALVTSGAEEHGSL